LTGGAGAAALVIALAVALIGALGGIIVAVLRLARTSPEQRQADTAAFTALTTGQGGFISTLQSRLTQLEERVLWLEEREDQLTAALISGGLPVPEPRTHPS